MSKTIETSAIDSPSLLAIDLNAIKENFRILKEKTHRAEIAGVVKANGYGLGAKKVVETLYQEGCRTFFVAHINEALEIREKFTDIELYVLNGLLTGTAEDFLQFNIKPVLNNLHDVNQWQIIAKNRNEELPCILHFDTGMNRLGLGIKETKELLSNKEAFLKGLNVEYIMSHFSSADEHESNETELQALRFKEITKHFTEIKASLANSAGIFVSGTYHYDLVRPGMALYGLNPQPHLQNPMRQVVKLQTRIFNIQEIEKGESVGYGATYRAKQTEKLATVSLGYADGFFRSLGEKSGLYWKDHFCPFRGRISMDLATVSLEGIKGDMPKVGDMLDVICKHQPPEKLAKDVIGGTIDYEILTSLGQRYQKVYLE